MSYKNILFRFLARLTLIVFLINIVSPITQYTFAAGTQYYVDFISGSDANDGFTLPWKTLAKVSTGGFLP